METNLNINKVIRTFQAIYGIMVIENELIDSIEHNLVFLVNGTINDTFADNTNLEDLGILVKILLNLVPKTGIDLVASDMQSVALQLQVHRGVVVPKNIYQIIQAA